jgi:hypothetical protein
MTLQSARLGPVQTVSSRRDLQGTSVTSQEARTDCITSGASVNIKNYSCGGGGYRAYTNTFHCLHPATPTNWWPRRDLHEASEQLGWFTHNGDPQQGMESTGNTPRHSRYLHTQYLTNCTHVFLRQDSTHRALRTSLQRPLPGFVPERQNTKALCARQTHHRVCRQGQACLHIQ